MPVTEYIVRTKDVLKEFKMGQETLRALNGVSVDIKRGEYISIMGPSGSGKTTLLSILGCMLTPTKGTVQVCGISTEGIDHERLARIRRQHIGFVFQSYHLFPTLTAAENVQMALDVRGERQSIARLRAQAALVRVGLESKGGAFPRELSGGEQQRIAIARAIIAEPSVILADEPTGALDGVNGQAVMAILSEIAKEGNRTVLVVTHDTRLLRFADNILYIEDGILKTGEAANPNVLRMRSSA